eukprot:60602-Amphidinium_carterae.1
MTLGATKVAVSKSAEVDEVSTQHVGLLVDNRSEMHVAPPIFTHVKLAQGPKLTIRSAGGHIQTVFLQHHGERRKRFR